MFTRKEENQNPKVGFFPSNRNVCLDLTELPKNFHEKKGADFLKGCENRVSDKS